jgi:two-component system, OmpR family, phosphate regulon sensor histidine kinase PhoR
MADPGSSIGRWRERALRLMKRGADRADGQAAPSHTPLASVPRLVDWHLVMMALPDAAVLLSPQSVVIEFNAKAAELFPQLHPGVAISAVSRDPDLLAGLGRIHAGTNQLTVAVSQRVPVERTLEATMSRLDGSGDVLVLLRDLSESTRIEQMRKDFVANASHELRTPLASIIGFIETLQGAAKSDPPAREKFLGVMGAQAQRMKRLVDDLMSLSRIEMRTHLMPRGEVDLNGILDDLRQSMAPLAAQDKVSLTITGRAQPALVQGDRDELMQVFQNLIHNAIRYGRTGGNVTVQIDRAGETRQLRVHVSDDGPGIAPQHLPRLTERFYRVDVAASRKKEGTGLGLAIAKHVVTRHRGELVIRSELGKGSTFTVVLPQASNRGGARDSE